MGISFRLDRHREEKGDETPDLFDLADKTERNVVVNREETAEKEPAEPEATPAADTKMVLRTDNLVKKYGKRTVANHVSIDVTQGEIVGLLGPNGAGKTTTFYMTVGLITPNEGRIFLNDLDITKYPVYKRAKQGIGYLAQDASVFRKLTVEDNIRAVLQLTPTTKEYQRDKLESLISIVLKRCARTSAKTFRAVSGAAPKLPGALPLTPSLSCLTNLLRESIPSL